MIKQASSSGAEHAAMQVCYMVSSKVRNQVYNYFWQYIFDNLYHEIAVDKLVPKLVNKTFYMHFLNMLRSKTKKSYVLAMNMVYRAAYRYAYNMMYAAALYIVENLEDKTLSTLNMSRYTFGVYKAEHYVPGQCSKCNEFQPYYDRNESCMCCGHNNVIKIEPFEELIL